MPSVRFTDQYLPLVPQLLVQIVGIVIAIVLFRRNNTVAVLVLIGMGAGVAASLAWPVYNTLNGNGNVTTWSAISVRTLFLWIGIVLRAVQTTLLLIAAFVGRGSASQSANGFEVSPRVGQRFGGPPTPPPMRTTPPL